MILGKPQEREKYILVVDSNCLSSEEAQEFLQSTQQLINRRVPNLSITCSILLWIIPRSNPSFEREIKTFAQELKMEIITLASEREMEVARSETTLGNILKTEEIVLRKSWLSFEHLPSLLSIGIGGLFLLLWRVSQERGGFGIGKFLRFKWR